MIEPFDIYVDNQVIRFSEGVWNKIHQYGSDAVNHFTAEETKHFNDAIRPLLKKPHLLALVRRGQ